MQINEPPLNQVYAKFARTAEKKWKWLHCQIQLT